MLLRPHFISSQSHQFGSSAFLQSGDYQSDADIYGFAESYQLTPTQLAFTLTHEATAFLSSEEPNQFRVGLNPPQFSNFNGEFHCWCLPGVLPRFAWKHEDPSACPCLRLLSLLHAFYSAR